MRKIRDHRLGYMIASLSRSPETTQYLREKGLNVLAVYAEGVYILRGDVVRVGGEELALQFEGDDAFDVFEITEDGACVKLYDTKSLDNALIITNACNSNCVMCPTPEAIRRKGVNMPYEALASIVEHFPSDACHITITGGEPFLMGKDIFRVFARLREKFTETEFLLLTNGRIFSVAEYCRLLQETLPENTLIGIPLHGYNEQTHDAITRAPGSFRQTFTGLKNLLKLGFNVEIRIIVSRLTTGTISDIAEMIATEFPTVRTVKVIGMEMLGNAAENAGSLWLPYREAFDGAESAVDRLLRAGIDVGLYNFPLCAVRKEYWGIACKSISEDKVRFAEACADCAVRDACGGMFAGSIRFAGKDVAPICKR